MCRLMDEHRHHRSSGSANYDVITGRGSGELAWDSSHMADELADTDWHTSKSVYDVLAL